MDINKTTSRPWRISVTAKLARTAHVNRTTKFLLVEYLRVNYGRIIEVLENINVILEAVCVPGHESLLNAAASLLILLAQECAGSVQRRSERVEAVVARFGKPRP